MNIKIKNWGEIQDYINPSNFPMMGISVLDVNLRWISEYKHAFYKVIDKEKFFLHVIKHGILFETID